MSSLNKSFLISIILVIHSPAFSYNRIQFYRNLVPVLKITLKNTFEKSRIYNTLQKKSDTFYSLQHHPIIKYTGFSPVIKSLEPASPDQYVTLKFLGQNTAISSLSALGLTDLLHTGIPASVLIYGAAVGSALHFTKIRYNNYVEKMKLYNEIQNLRNDVTQTVQTINAAITETTVALSNGITDSKIALSEEIENVNQNLTQFDEKTAAELAKIYARILTSEQNLNSSIVNTKETVTNTASMTQYQLGEIVKTLNTISETQNMMLTPEQQETLNFIKQINKMIQKK